MNDDVGEFLNSPRFATALAWHKRFVPEVFGKVPCDRGLQIGMPLCDSFAGTPVLHRVLCLEGCSEPPENFTGNTVAADPAALPFKNECAGAVSWPCGPDFCPADPKSVFDEFMRVLAPEGVLLVTFFNPSGSWAIKRKLFGAGPLPKSFGRHTVTEIKKALCDAGFSIEGGMFGVYAENGNPDAFTTSRLPSWMDKAGDRWWPTMSNIVMLVAKKRTPGMRLVGKACFSQKPGINAAHGLAKAGAHGTKTIANLMTDK